MRNNLNGIVTLMLVSFGLRAQEPAAVLMLNGASRDSRIWIDGESRPYAAEFAVTPGFHRVRVAHPNRLGYHDLDFEDTVTVAAGERRSIKVTFRQLLMVQSRPSGAAAFIDSTNLGETPLAYDLTGWNGKNMTLSKKGFSNRVVVIDDSLLVSRSIFVELTPEGRKPLVENEFSKSLPQTGLRQHAGKIWLSAVSGIVCGIATAYWKETADNAFEKAKLARRTGDLSRTNHYEKKARRFDDLAVTGLLGVQISAGSLMFFFLISK